jgi:rare lipoprotein A
MTWQRCAQTVFLIAMMLAVWPRSASAAQPSQAAPRRDRHPLNAHTVQHRTVQFGVASYYGAWHRGRITASGVPFDDRKLTAAHRTLPLGTHVQVTNLKNGRSVIVKINDRGPYVHHRLIDLSAAAARVLGFRHRGLAPVRVRVIDTGKKQPDLDQADAGQSPLNGGGGA